VFSSLSVGLIKMWQQQVSGFWIVIKPLLPWLFMSLVVTKASGDE